MEKCAYHDQLAKDTSSISTSMALLQRDIEYLRRDQEVILARFGKHVEDAEKDGGRHERLANAESAIESLATQRQNDLIMSRWFMLGSGVIGGGVVSGAIKVWGGLSKILGV